MAGLLAPNPLGGPTASRSSYHNRDRNEMYDALERSYEVMMRNWEQMMEWLGDLRLYDERMEHGEHLQVTIVDVARSKKRIQRYQYEAYKAYGELIKYRRMLYGF